MNLKKRVQPKGMVGATQVSLYHLVHLFLRRFLALPDNNNY